MNPFLLRDPHLCDAFNTIYANLHSLSDAQDMPYKGFDLLDYSPAVLARLYTSGRGLAPSPQLSKTLEIMLECLLTQLITR